MTLPPAVTIHGLPHARVVLALQQPVLLLSAPGAASYAGAAWWRALIGQTGHAPDAIDCADQPGRALEALALGCRIVILHPTPASPVVADRAGSALILTARPLSLDLADRGARRHLDRWLRGDSTATIG